MNKLTVQVSIALLILFSIAIACTNEPKEKEEEPDEVEEYPLTENSFKAIPMPSQLVNGESYPTDSTTINGWVASSAVDKNGLETNEQIIAHGWAIWKALTQITGEKSSLGEQLRRFETWYTPNDIIEAYKQRGKNGEAKLVHVNRHTGHVQRLHQFHGTNLSPIDAEVGGFVKYNPPAAEHIYNNNLYYKSVLEGMKKEGEIARIPEFPLGGIALKPVFVGLTAANKNEDGTYTVPSWPGPPQKGGKLMTDQAFGSEDWNDSIFVTLDGESDPKNNIFSVKDFIHFKMDSAQVATPEPFIQDTKVGDVAILVGMHVTTKENKRWTWQSFWWSRDPDKPNYPSSKLHGKLRKNAQLDRAADHYAMSIAYNMVVPAQPYYGGANGPDKKSIYGFNPYLEAGFGDSTFMADNAIIQNAYPEGKNYQLVGGKFNNWGMETNCMSCHGQARVPGTGNIPGTSIAQNFYISDQYFDLDAPYFKNTVTLDFVWSIQGNLIDGSPESK